MTPVDDLACGCETCREMRALRADHPDLKLTTSEQFHNLGVAASKMGAEVNQTFTKAMQRFGVPVETKPQWRRLWWVPPYFAALMCLLCLFIAASFVIRDGDLTSALIAGGIAAVNLAVAGWLVWLHRAVSQ